MITSNENLTMSNGIDIVKRTMKEAFASKITADGFLRNPAAAFEANGLSIPKGLEEGFNSHFNQVAGDFVTQLMEASEEQRSQLLESLGFGCTACEIAAYSVAIILVALGAIGLGGLTVGSTVVASLAAFAGVSTGVAYSFIIGLVSVVGSGVSVVANRICGWTGACAI